MMIIVARPGVFIHISGYDHQYRHLIAHGVFIMT